MPNRIAHNIEHLITSITSSQDILQSKTQTMEVKLALLVEVLKGRLDLHSKSKHEIENSSLKACQAVDYWQENRELGLDYPKDEYVDGLRRLQTFEDEARNRDSECWRDSVGLMRDILDTWEALQGAKARQSIVDDDQ